MQISKRTWPEIKAELSERLRSNIMPLSELAKQSGVNYHAIRRLKQGGIEKRTENALTLCIFFKIELQNRKSIAGDKLILEAVQATWDGTDEHAQLIADLIRSTSGYIVQKRKKRDDIKPLATQQ